MIKKLDYHKIAEETLQIRFSKVSSKKNYFNISLWYLMLRLVGIQYF